MITVEVSINKPSLASLSLIRNASTYFNLCLGNTRLTGSTGMSGCYSIYGFEYKPARE
jgi:hypothetical protein